MVRMSKSAEQIDKLTLGKHLCLNFANTVDWRLSTRPHEYLSSYYDLVTWSRRVGVLTQKEAQRLLRVARRHQRQADTAFRRAIELRDRIFRIFSAVAAGRQPQEPDLEALNGILSKTLPRLRVIASAQRFEWEWSGTENELDKMLWPVVRSTAELLVSEDVTRVRECAGEDCGWLFEDVSRNRLRRWCEMKICGNRAKARRHYQRVKRAPRNRTRQRG
jgi:predicted RNA-binding Zn ribbon-like protein